MAAIAQTIAIVDRSGKVVGTSKQLKNVFKEAKLAYLERRAEIAVERKAKEERELQKAIKALSVADDERSDISRQRTRRQPSHSHNRDAERDRRPPAPGRHHSNASMRSSYSDRSSISESPRSPDDPPRYSPQQTSLSDYNEQAAVSRSVPASPTAQRPSNELVRRRTDLDLAELPPRPPPRSYSTTELDSNVDMDLAYGEFYHDQPLTTRQNDAVVQKQELSSLVLKCKMLLDEANCAQHSVKAIVAHLQKNPDAMAAVALTLAEISNIATKMAPGALAAFKTGAPAVFAMLAAPEFLIAVGVGVGITVVMFGGYKIIKKIKAATSDKEESMDEMLAVGELDHIEHWRRGIADSSDTASIATSVEGEYITPMAAASMGHLPQTAASSSGRNKSKDKDTDKNRSSKDKDKKEKKHRHSSRHADDLTSEAGNSERSHRRRRSSSSTIASGSVVEGGSGNSRRLNVPGAELKGGKEKAVIKVKKPSPLRRMFTNRDATSSVSGG